MSIEESSDMTIVESRVIVSHSFLGAVFSSVFGVGKGSVPDNSEVFEDDDGS